MSKNKNIELVPSQNEQGASLAADAYTRVSGKMGRITRSGTKNISKGR